MSDADAPLRKERVKRYIEMIQKNLTASDFSDLDEAVDKTREFFSAFGIDEDAFSEAVASIKRDLGRRVRRIRDPYVVSKRHPRWYDENAVHAMHWPALATYLREKKGWGQDQVDSISRSSANIVAELGDPKSEQFDVRGLVVGYVQSGKTANMTAVIARAVDAGYNFVIVLAGTTDKLRHQTQKRLEEDLISRHPNNWHLLTRMNTYDKDSRLEKSGDYEGQPGRPFPRLPSDVARLAVIKKNRAQIVRLTRDIDAALPEIREQFRVLVIDDEADLASPNAGRSDEEPTVINRKIRKLLNMFNCISYVGYTATPYANVLINPFPVRIKDGGENDLCDLYPRDFIISLPKPDQYFGAEEIFGRDPVNADDTAADGLDVIRTVDEEEARLLGAERRAASLGEVRGLQTALRWFFLAAAARLARGHSSQHSTMLVHTSHRIEAHREIRDLLEPEVRRLREIGLDEQLQRELKNLWDEEAPRVDGSLFGNAAISFREVSDKFGDVASRLHIVVENYQSEERLDYEGDSSAVIVIGGNILSRGLTLEGLVVSYFLRRSRQYDTLLQMGRWFGYREGYEDLVRLWMPEDVRETFRQLSAVEYELRQEIEEYAIRDARPLDFAVRILTLPGLQVTARNKMRHARTARIDYRGMHLQTIRFARLDRQTLKRNWEAGSVLVESARIDGPGVVGVADVDDIIRFLRAYQVHPSHRELSSEWLEKYVMENRDMLEKWSVVVYEPREGHAQEASVKLGSFRPRMVRRSRLAGTPDEIADIKALMSRADVLLDVPHEQHPADCRGWEWSLLKKYREDKVGQRPLLVLYAIDRVSPPQRETSLRVPLDAVEDVLGFGMVFPYMGVATGERAKRYIEVDLHRSRYWQEDDEADHEGGWEHQRN